MATAKENRYLAEEIGALEVERVTGPGDQKDVALSSFWAEQPVVIHFLRRFGCQLCRGGAVDLGKIFPQLEAAGVRIVGIGIEKIGLEDFQKGGFWQGELYIDNGKKIHKKLHMQKVGVFGSVKMLLTNKEMKDAFKSTKDTPGDLKGDGRQLGGTFVIAKGGDTLLDFRQSHFGDHLSNVKILEALGLDTAAAMAAGQADPADIVCT